MYDVQSILKRHYKCRWSGLKPCALGLSGNAVHLVTTVCVGFGVLSIKVDSWRCPKYGDVKLVAAEH